MSYQGLNRLVVSFSVAACLLLSACDSGGDNDPIIDPPDEIEGEMFAEISGKEFVADSSVTARYIGSTLIVSGSDSTNRTMLFSVQGADRPGTYVLGDVRQTATATYIIGSDEYTTLSDSSGTLRITRLDTLATRGVFQFTASMLDGSLIAVEQGEFIAPFKDD